MSNFKKWLIQIVMRIVANVVLAFAARLFA